MRWVDTFDIAIALDEKFPNEEVLSLRFTDLHAKVCELDEFSDDPQKSNEKVLEAIQMAWLDEQD